jgi:hypothetical protein
MSTNEAIMALPQNCPLSYRACLLQGLLFLCGISQQYNY